VNSGNFSSRKAIIQIFHQINPFLANGMKQRVLLLSVQREEIPDRQFSDFINSFK